MRLWEGCGRGATLIVALWDDVVGKPENRHILPTIDSGMLEAKIASTQPVTIRLIYPSEGREIPLHVLLTCASRPGALVAFYGDDPKADAIAYAKHRYPDHPIRWTD